MGYESKVTIVGKYYNDDHFAENIMTLNLSKMGKFSSIFTRPISDFGIYFYLEDGNTKVDGTFKDPYGSEPMVCGVNEVLVWLKENLDKRRANGEIQYCRRELMLYDSLKTFKRKQWKDTDIYVVHMGY